MNQDIILNIDSIYKSFVRNIVNIRGKGEDERFHILDDFDLLVPRGKITALIGGNGAGKTTLFNIISGFFAADKGKISFLANGSPTEIFGMTAYKIARLGIGRMFQDNHIFQNMTVLENMLVADNDFFGERPFESFLFPKRYRILENQRQEKAEQIFIDLFGPDNPFLKMINSKAKDLSYGQQRLLGLARLLMGDYKLLLLDEPTSGVNPANIKKVMEVVKYFVEKKDLTVFLIEHNMKVVLDVADFCSFMSHGRVTAFGTPEDVIGNVEVRKKLPGGVMLSLMNVSAGYTKGNMILKGVDLEVGDNEVVAIVGQNGSGKSTLAKSIMNMVTYREGTFVFNGINITKFSTREISKLGIGFFMQGGRIFPNLTVEENLIFAAGGLRKKENLLRKDRIKDFFELSLNNGKIYASYLSGGEQHMLALAMTLMKEPKFLILDEPSAGLSPANVKMMYEVIYRIKKEEVNSILIIEQNVASAIEFSDRVALLQGGKIVREEFCIKLNSMTKIDGFYFEDINIKETLNEKN